MPKINPRGPFTLNYNFTNFFINVIKSSTEVAVTNIIASLNATLDPMMICLIRWPRYKWGNQALKAVYEIVIGNLHYGFPLGNLDYSLFQMIMCIPCMVSLSET